MPQKKRRRAINSRAKCLTDNEVLEDLKAREEEKVRKEEELRVRKQERQRKKEEKLKEKARKKPTQKKKQPCKTKITTRRKMKELSEQLQRLSIQVTDETESGDESSEAECPNCGLAYGEDDSVWIQCDSCGLWWDLKCTEIDDKNIPDIFICKKC